MSARIGSRSTFVREAWFAYAAVVVLGLLAIAGLLASNYDSMDALLRDVPYAVPGVLALVAVIAAAIEGVRDFRTGARLRHVARLRSGATVRPVQSFNAMVETAHRLRASGAGVGYSEWSCQVLAIHSDRTEYWATSGDEPRWSVPCASEEVSLVPVQVGMRRIDMLRIADTASPAKIEVRPVLRPVWTSYRARYRQEAMEQLVRDLGCEPSDVLVEP
jgi:hypothetical protein